MNEWLAKLIEKLAAKCHTFVHLHIGANHDLPYHDILFVDNSQGGTTLEGYYVVGENNVQAHGNQRKRFVSKHTYIRISDFTITVSLNDVHNLNIIGTVNPLELFTSIHSVYYSVVAGATLYALFEGVLPQEARNPE